MDITIQRLPDGRLQAYGEDLEHARQVITMPDEAESSTPSLDFYLRLERAIDEVMPREKHWEPPAPDPDLVCMPSLGTLYTRTD